jgi:predicted DNA-binding protein
MKPPSKTLTIRIPLTITDEIERIAEKRQLTSAQVVRMCLDLGVECHKDMEKLGLIGVVDFTYYATKALKEQFSNLQGKQLSLP